MLRAPIVRVTQIDVFEPDAEGDVGEGETVADEIIAAAIVGVGETQRARDLAFLPLDERGVLRDLRAPRLQEARDQRVDYALAQRVPALHLPARLAGGRNQGRAAHAIKVYEEQQRFEYH